MCHKNGHTQSPKQREENEGQDCSRCDRRRWRRRRKGRFFRFVGLVVLLWATATVSYRYGHRIVGFVTMKKLAHEMELTWVQKDRLMGTFFAAYQKTRAQKAELHKIKSAFYALLDKPELTQKEMDAFIRKSMAKIQEMALTHSVSLVQARNILSPYQRKVLIVRLQQMEKKRARRHRRWGFWRRHHHRHHASMWRESQAARAQVEGQPSVFPMVYDPNVVVQLQDPASTNKTPLHKKVHKASKSASSDGLSAGPASRPTRSTY